MVIKCADVECKYYNDGNCIATNIDHTSDRFYTTGRRKEKDDAAGLMKTFNSLCRPTLSGYKSNHRKTFK